MTYNFPIEGVDEAALLISLGFPCSAPRRLQHVDANSQSRVSLQDRFIWDFAPTSPRGDSIETIRASFRLPKPDTPATGIGQLARLAAVNYQALKSSLIHRQPLTQKLGPNYTILRNAEGTPIPTAPATAPTACSCLPAVAISCALGHRLAAFGFESGQLFILPAPTTSAPPLTTPADITAYLHSPESEAPEDFSPLAVLAAMFKNRDILMREAHGRRLVFHRGSRYAVLPGSASEHLQNLAYRFLF